MINQFTKKKIEQHLEHCHTSALAYIEMVTSAALFQMQAEGRVMDPTVLDPFIPEEIGKYAAKNLGVNAEQLIIDYTALLVLEGMVVQVQEIHHYRERGM